MTVRELIQKLLEQVDYLDDDAQVFDINKNAYYRIKDVITKENGYADLEIDTNEAE